MHGIWEEYTLQHRDCKVMTAAEILRATRPGSQQPSFMVKGQLAQQEAPVLRPQWRVAAMSQAASLRSTAQCSVGG